MCGAEPSVPSCLSDLEKSVEEIQKESSVNHKLVTVQELEEKSAALRKLGETLTELKSESRRLICSVIQLLVYLSGPHPLHILCTDTQTDKSNCPLLRQPVCDTVITHPIADCLVVEALQSLSEEYFPH